MSAERRRCEGEARAVHLSMKKKTSDAQRRTLNAEWSAHGVRLRETPTGEYGNNKSPPKYDLEDRLLDFSVNVVELTESLPNKRSGNHIAAQLLRCGTSPLSNHGEVEAAESRKGLFPSFSVSMPTLHDSRCNDVTVSTLHNLTF